MQSLMYACACKLHKSKIILNSWLPELHKYMFKQTFEIAVKCLGPQGEGLEISELTLSEVLLVFTLASPPALKYQLCCFYYCHFWEIENPSYCIRKEIRLISCYAFLTIKKSKCRSLNNVYRVIPWFYSIEVWWVSFSTFSTFSPRKLTTSLRT